MNKLLTIASLVLLVSCGQQKVNLIDEEEKILQCWKDWPKKSIAGDPAYYFADSAIVMGQEQPSIKGKGEISKFYSAMPKIPELKVNWGERPNIVEFSKDGEMAFSIDTLKLSMTDSTGTVQTKINQGLHVWKKDNEGNWKVSLLLLYPKK